MSYRFTTRCPRCHAVNEIVSRDLDPVANCGECLMNDVEVVKLECTLIKEPGERNVAVAEPLRSIINSFSQGVHP